MLTLTIFVIFLTTSKVNSQPNKIVCNYSPQAHKNPGNFSFVVNDIDPSLCTHLVYSYLQLERNQMLFADFEYEPAPPDGLGNVNNFTDLKKTNPTLKVYGAVGGENTLSLTFSNMANSTDARTIFITSVVEFLYFHNFDGFMLDWEYPTMLGGNSEDKENFVQLVKELGFGLKLYDMELAIAVAPTKYTAGLAYDIPNIHPHVDFIVLKTYELRSPWSKYTGYIAPLHSDKLSVEHCVNYWLGQGAPPEKLVIGIPFYGMVYILEDSEKHHLNSTSMKAGSIGVTIAKSGFLAYNEICTSELEEVYDKESGGLYAYRGKMWVSYENDQTISQKIEFVKNNELGGISVWSLEYDDFNGICGGGKFPLLKAIHKGLT